jgi:dihydrofolate reductase
MKVYLIAALTADGMIARDQDQISTSWTSDEDRKWFWRRTKQTPILIMGRKNYQATGKLLPKRQTIVMTRQKTWPAVGSIPAQPVDALVRAAELEPESTGLFFTNKTPTEILKFLADKNYSEVAICGGSSIYTQFAKADLIDDYYLTVEPIFFGQGIGLFNEVLDLKLTLVESQALNPNTLWLHYQPQR